MRAGSGQDPDNSFGAGWHEWTDATGFWQRHDFPKGDDSCWCGTYIPWRKALEERRKAQEAMASGERRSE